MRHYARRDVLNGNVEIMDREFDFVRAVLPYDYRWTCNAQQWNEAERICEVLEGPMISLGIVAAAPFFECPSLRSLDVGVHADIVHRIRRMGELRAADSSCADQSGETIRDSCIVAVLLHTRSTRY